MHRTFSRRTLGWSAMLVLGSVACSLARAEPPAAAPAGLTRLSPLYEVWVDKQHKRVVVVGEICLNQGPLELFACLKRTKEHEAIVTARTKAYLVHAGLIAVGAAPGNTARWTPEYVPARGTSIEVTLYWSDEQGQRREARAQQWLRGIKDGKEMSHDWVFAGSGFWVDRETGERHYQAEEGDFICVSNFPTAMLDLPIPSSQSNDALAFEAFTERIPKLKTRVTMVLTPALKDLPKKRGGDPQVDLLPPTEAEKAKE